jgi:acyl-CoA synthetase (NDP forming)
VQRIAYKNLNYRVDHGDSPTLVYGVFGGSLMKRIMQRGKHGLAVREERALVEVFDSQADTMCQAFKGCGKPVIGASFDVRRDSSVRRMIEKGNIPFYRGPERAVKALEALWRYKKIKDNIPGNSWKQ